MRTERSRFSGRRILVTGASGGIGEAVARRAWEEGGEVYASDLDAPVLDGPTCLQLNAADADSWSTALGIVEEQGPLDVLLLCHGISQPQVSVFDLPEEDWDRVLRVNLTSCFLGLKSVVPGMVEREFGRVVALASIAAKEASAREHVYAASKAGLVALVNTVAREVATSGVTLNTVAPGPVTTPLWNALGDDVKTDRLRKTPMNRPGTPDEIASIVLWLASEEASYTTAQCFDSSGGRATY